MNKLSSFYINGEAVDHEWLINNHEQLEAETRNDMRKKGFIPAIDIALSVSWEYDHKRKVCVFKGVAKGLKVGRKKSLATPDIGYLASEGIVVSDNATKAKVLV